MGALSTLRGLAGGLWRDVVRSRVEEGRLRGDGWPYGLREIVIIVLTLFGLAATLVVVGPLLRQSDRLVSTPTSTTGLPEQTIWLLVFLITVLVALVHAACLHGAWWLKGLGLLVTVLAVISWGIAGTFTGSGVELGFLVAAACSSALLIFTVLRWPRAFRWWEFPVALGLFGPVVLATVITSGYRRSFGFELTPALVQQTLATVGFLAIPAAMVAGVAVAELAINATLVLTRRVQRLTDPATRRPSRAVALLPYLILGALVLIRVGQSITEIIDLDPVSQGPATFGVVALALALLAGLGVLVLRIGRRHAAEVRIGLLPEHLAAVGLPVAAALAGLLIPLLVLGAAITALAALDPLGMAGQRQLDLAVIGDQTEPVRVLTGVLCIVVGLVTSRRGRPGRGLLLCCIGVMLFGQATQLLSGYRFTGGLDLTVVNLLATLIALALIGWSALRRRLTALRALALSGLLVLSALVSAREVVADPFEALFGYSGSLVVLFGLLWSFLTASGWGNGDSRRFPRPTRVLLVLANLVLTAILLACLVLLGNLDVIVDLESFADFGDTVFGSGLAAAAYLALISALRGERPIG